MCLKLLEEGVGAFVDDGEWESNGDVRELRLERGYGLYFLVGITCCLAGMSPCTKHTSMISCHTLTEIKV